MSTTVPGLHPIRTLFGNCHVLVEGGRAVVLDTALGPSARRQFDRVFARLGLDPASRVDAIVLSHGHLDHAGNAAWLKARTGAPVYAHPAERAHVHGTYPYRRLARVCGFLEALGRRAFGYRPARIDHPLRDGQLLRFWGGLRVVHLPGHSDGHCGFWSERHRLLFAGDLVAIWSWRTTFPPPIFNSDGRLLRPSLAKAADLDPRLVVPCHYNRYDPAWMAQRFASFARRKLRG